MTLPQMTPLQQATRLANEWTALGGRIEAEGPGDALEMLRSSDLLKVGVIQGGDHAVSADETLSLLFILKEIGRGSLPIGRIYEGHLNAIQLVKTFGKQEQISGFISDVSAGHLSGIWNTGNSESDVTLEELPDQRYRLHGKKVFASGSGFLTRPIVTGTRPDGGWQMMIMKLDKVSPPCDPSWWNPMGMNASASYRMDFEGMEVEQSDLIGASDDYSKEPWLSGGSIRFSAVQLGGAEALLETTRDHLKNVGRTEHPFHQERVARMSIDIESGNLWLHGAAKCSMQAESNPTQWVNYVGMARSAIEEICFNTVKAAQQCIGVQGMLRPHPMERQVRDLLTYLRQPNPDGALVGVGRYVLGSPLPIESLWKLRHE